MLQAPADFPHAGSRGYLRGTAQQATIIQHNADGTSTVKLHPPTYMTAQDRLAWAAKGASLTRRVERGDIYPTERDAVFCGRPPKGRSRSRRAR